MQSTFYPTFNPSQLNEPLTAIDATQATIQALRPQQPERWAAIQQKLRAEWTYNSNAIEGSTLTLGETIFFLQEGLTVEGKPFKDFLDARNHAEAIDVLFDIIAQQRAISVGLIKEINALLLAGVIYYYVEPLQVPSEMQQLCNWVNQHLNTLHAITVAGVAHYNMVRIHPFDDGNGRGARILMNLILLMQGYTPVIVRHAKRRFYLEALAAADQGDLVPFLAFIADAMQDTQQLILSELQAG